MMLIGMEADEQRQIDRACAAQSSELLPKPKVNKSSLDKARERVMKQKQQYTKPVSPTTWNKR